MLTGFYTAASGILMQERALNVLTDNLANMKTPGFRASRVVSTTFDQVMSRIERGNNEEIGSISSIRVVDEVPTLFDPNYLEETGRELDMAIVGEGFFNVENTAVQGAEVPADETAPEAFLTRNGNFDLDAEGYLILEGVGRVLGEQGPIQVGTSNFTVSAAGSIYNDYGAEVGRLLITVPGGDVEVRKYGNGLYTSQPVENPDPAIAGQQPAVAGLDFKVVQNTLEAANIDFNREMAMVMEAQRAFQACSSALKIMDQINQKSAQSLAAVQ